MGKLQVVSGTAFRCSATRAISSDLQYSGEIWYANFLIIDFSLTLYDCIRLRFSTGRLRVFRDALLEKEPALLDSLLHRAVDSGNDNVSSLLR